MSWIEQGWADLRREIREVDEKRRWRTRYWCSKCKRIHRYDGCSCIAKEHLPFAVPTGEMEVSCEGCGRKFKRKEKALRPVILPAFDERLEVRVAFYKWIIPPQILEKIGTKKRIVELCDECFKTYLKPSEVRE